MPTNTSLPREQGVLAARCRHKKQNVEHLCPACGEVYHPAKQV